MKFLVSIELYCDCNIFGGFVPRPKIMVQALSDDHMCIIFSSVPVLTFNF